VTVRELRVNIIGHSIGQGVQRNSFPAGSRYAAHIQVRPSVIANPYRGNRCRRGRVGFNRRVTSRVLQTRRSSLGLGHNFPPYADRVAAVTGVDLNNGGQAADSTNCTLHVPGQPLQALCLSSPYICCDGARIVSTRTCRRFVEADNHTP